MTRCRGSLRRGRPDGLYICDESEGNPGKHNLTGYYCGEQITRKASKAMVGRCEGMDRTELVEGSEANDHVTGGNG